MEIEHPAVLTEVEFYFVHRDGNHSFTAIGEPPTTVAEGFPNYKAVARFTIKSNFLPGVYELKGFDIKTAGGSTAAYGENEIHSLGHRELPSFVVAQEPERLLMKITNIDIKPYS